MTYPSEDEVEEEAERSMRKAAAIAGFLFICGGLWCIAWMFPFFTLNEPYLSWYGELLFGPEWNAPGGAGSAAPFLWILTAPLGVLLMVIGVPMLHWGQRRA